MKSRFMDAGGWSPVEAPGRGPQGGNYVYIGQVARLAGTTTKTIRYYESLGILPLPQRKGRYRVYSQDSVELLNFIKCAQSLGFKLEELRETLRDCVGGVFPWARVHDEVQRKKAELERQMALMREVYGRLEGFQEWLKCAHACSGPSVQRSRTGPTRSESELMHA